MKITSEQVTRFITNNCSPEEAEMLAGWFADHPDELEKIISTPEWEQFRTQESIPEETDAAIWQYIQQRKKPVRIYYFRRIAAAAAIIGIIAGSLLVWKQQEPKHFQAKIKQADTSAVSYTVLTNTGKQDETYHLEDGTTVVLSASSRLKYAHPFGRKQRYISLEGKAFFDVAKDKDRPFIVAAGGLTTTALGTSFRITAVAGDHKIYVQLITGKVVLQKIHSKGDESFKPVFLEPGQQLVFNIKQDKAFVSNSKRSEIKTPPAIIAAKDINEQQFHQEPLKKVFLTLQSYYHTTITFDEQQLKNMKFSGAYTASDKVEDILTVITLVNGLKLEKTPEGYNITR
jgi:transmembrane sensor